MPGIDETIPFQPLNVAVLTVSDTRTSANDTSGDILANRAKDAGHIVADRKIVSDDIAVITSALQEWIGNDNVDVVVATGGTGVTGRDVTTEAFQEVYEKEIVGFGELFRMLSYKIIGTSTIQSRATGGVAGGTYLFALPGSNGAVKDGWDGILKDQLDIRYRPCNFAELIPRLTEHLDTASA